VKESTASELFFSASNRVRAQTAITPEARTKSEETRIAALVLRDDLGKILTVI
jgi:hypothetical protein